VNESILSFILNPIHSLTFSFILHSMNLKPWDIQLTLNLQNIQRLS
jgi:hypothetical protein